MQQTQIDRLLPVLVAENFEVEVARDPTAALGIAITRTLDLILLDVHLQLCAELRRRGIDTSLIMLTDERVRALRLGADDSVPRSCDTGELLARIEAIARRIPKKKNACLTRIRFGDVDVDFDAAEARKNGRRIALSLKEAGLLRYLFEHRHRVITREEALKHVWEYDASVSSRTIDVHIGWLRQKLEDDPQSPRYIKTIRGRGYRFDAA